MPPVSMKSPAKIKKGTARSGKESRPVNIFWARMVRGIPPLYKIAPALASPMEIPMGNDSAISPQNAEKSNTKTTGTSVL
jgi:hypothetical protein